MYLSQETTGGCALPTWGCKPRKGKALDPENREYKQETHKEASENSVKHQGTTSSNWNKRIQDCSRNLKDKRRTVRLPNTFDYIKRTFTLWEDFCSGIGN